LSCEFPAKTLRVGSAGAIVIWLPHTVLTGTGAARRLWCHRNLYRANVPAKWARIDLPRETGFEPTQPQLVAVASSTRKVKPS